MRSLLKDLEDTTQLETATSLQMDPLDYQMDHEQKDLYYEPKLVPCFSDFSKGGGNVVYFNGDANRKIMIEKYSREAYHFKVRSKIDTMFSRLDSISAESCMIKLDEQLKSQIKETMIKILRESDSNPKFYTHLTSDMVNKPAKILIKYLFISVVYLVLRNKFFIEKQDFLYEVGILELVDKYGSSEISQGRLIKYINFAKAILKE